MPSSTWPLAGGGKYGAKLGVNMGLEGVNKGTKGARGG